jgi:hypothetical protein
MEIKRISPKQQNWKDMVNDLHNLWPLNIYSKILFIQKKLPHNGNACKKESSPQVRYEHQRHSPTKNTRPCITLVPHQLHTICDFSDFQLKTCAGFVLGIDWQVEIGETWQSSIEIIIMISWNGND